MKNLYSTLIAFFLLTTISAQAPQNITYQGVASLSNGTFIRNKDISIKIEITEQENFQDVTKLEEHHTATTSEFGIFSILIGEGDTKFGSFTAVDWSLGEHKIEVSIDPDGGTNFIFLGETELSSVPYALYARDEDYHPRNEIQHLYTKPAGPLAFDLFLTQSDDSVRIASSLDKLKATYTGVPNDPSGWANLYLQSDPLSTIPVDSDPTNELQNLKIFEKVDILGFDYYELELSDAAGNKQTVDIYDLENEYQNLESLIRTDVVTQSKVTELKLIDADGFVRDSFIIFDTDHTNEIQTPLLTLQEGANGIEGSFNLSNSGVAAVTFPDLDPTNELQSLTYNAGFLGITNGGGIEVPLTPWEQVTPMSIHYDGYASISNQLVVDGPGYFSNVTGTNNIFSANFRTPSGDLMMNDEYIMLNNNIFLYNDGVLQAHTIQAEIKNFVMDHPEDPNKQIFYVSLEGPEAGAYERGTSKLIDGQCFVPYSDHFKLVIGENVPTAILTPQSIETYGLAVVKKTSEGFLVKELMGRKGNFTFDWEVKAVRDGFEDYKVIREKK